MAVNMQTALDDHIAPCVSRVKVQRHATEAVVVWQLVEAGHHEVVG